MLLNCVAGETLENPLDCKKIKPVSPKGNQPWIFIGRTDSEVPIFWPPDANSQLIGEDPDAGKDWRQKEKGTTEHEMFGWYYWLNGHEFEQASRDCDGQQSLACCSPWDRKESDPTEQLKLGWTELNCTVDKKQICHCKVILLLIACTQKNSLIQLSSQDFLHSPSHLSKSDLT